MSNVVNLIYEEVPIKVPDHYRLDGWLTGVTHRKFCALLFPVGFSRLEAMRIIRKELGLFPLFG